MPFIRVKTKSALDATINTDRIEVFTNAEDKGTIIVLISGMTIDVEESPRVVRGLIQEANTF